MYCPSRWIFVAFTCVFLSAGIAWGGDGVAIDSAWLARARVEVRDVQERYQALATRLEEVAEFHFDETPGPQGKLYPWRTRYRKQLSICLNGNRLCETEVITADAPDQPQYRLYCENEDYWFTLGKFGNAKSDSPYSLIKCIPERKDSPLPYHKAIHAEVFAHLAEALDALNEESGFDLQTVRFEESGKLLRVEYTKPIKHDDTIQVKLVVEPGQGWRVVDRQSTSPSGTSKAQWTYGTSLAGLWFPAESNNSVDYAGEQWLSHRQIKGKVLSLKPTDKTPADFRLPAFDLDVPADLLPLSEPIPWHLWGPVVAGICAVLVVTTWNRRRNSARAAAVGSQ